MAVDGVASELLGAEALAHADGAPELLLVRCDGRAASPSLISTGLLPGLMSPEEYDMLLRKKENMDPNGPLPLGDAFGEVPREETCEFEPPPPLIFCKCEQTTIFWATRHPWEVALARARACVRAWVRCRVVICSKP